MPQEQAALTLEGDAQRLTVPTALGAHEAAHVAEDGIDGQFQLVERILWKVLPALFLEDCLVGITEFHESGGVNAQNTNVVTTALRKGYVRFLSRFPEGGEEIRLEHLENTVRISGMYTQEE